jgi:hypothetical protein
MMNLDNLYKGQYFKTADIKQPLLLTVSSTTVDKVGEDTVAVLHFQEADQALTLTKGRYASMKDMTGTAEDTSWVGQQIVLEVDPSVKYQGVAVGGMIIRPPKIQPKVPAEVEVTPAAAKVEAAVMSDDIPF